jgi:hypothetical protein
MKNLPVIYLDQSHLSDVAKAGHGHAIQFIREMLVQRHIRLAISFFHVLETGRPNFGSRDSVVDFVDSIEPLWLPKAHDLFALEAEAAIGYSCKSWELKIDPLFETFHESQGNQELELPIGVPPFRAVTTAHRWLNNGRLEASFLGSMEEAVAVGSDAAILRSPDTPYLCEIEKAFARMNLRSNELLDSKVYLDAGGASAFPALQTLSKMYEVRLRNQPMKPKVNTLVDDYHSIYGPYVDIISLDGGAHQRLLETKLGWVNKAVRDLDSAEMSIKRVLAQ